MLLDHSAAICGSAVARAPNGQAAAAVRQVFAAVRLQAAACPPPPPAPQISLISSNDLPLAS
jgi:hypothetical protein